MEIRGDMRDVVDDIVEHLPACKEKYPSSCSRTAMHAIELIDYIRDQPKEVRRHLVATLREVSRPYHWGDYEDLMKQAHNYKV